MVGTAVYQVGLRILHPAKEFQRVEARRAPDRCAGRERGRHRRDQPVDMKQRHHVEAAVGRRQRQRRADVARRGHEVRLQQRHDLRAAMWCRTCAGSARRHRAWRRRCWMPGQQRHRKDVNCPAGKSGRCFKPQHRDAALPRRPQRPGRHSPAMTTSALAFRSSR